MYIYIYIILFHVMYIYIYIFVFFNGGGGRGVLNPNKKEVFCDSNSCAELEVRKFER